MIERLRGALVQAHVKRHLHDCAKGCSHVVLWLDCDREGENICFEVLECAVPAMAASRPRRHVWRARFSAISAPEITSAMANLGEPNENEALAVDARQELDLKVYIPLRVLVRVLPELGIVFGTRCLIMISG